MNYVLDFVKTAAEAVGLTSDAFLILTLLGVFGYAFYITIRNDNNPIKLWHFFASYNPQTQGEMGDTNKLGMLCGVVAALFVIIWVVYKTNDINPWLLGLCLVYLGGVNMFAAWLRAVGSKKMGVTETTTSIDVQSQSITKETQNGPPSP